MVPEAGPVGLLGVVQDPTQRAGYTVMNIIVISIIRSIYSHKSSLEDGLMRLLAFLFVARDESL